jgi:pyridoxamine 5'-phosphate oxidase
VPHKVEFWKRKPFRLHERVLYEKKASGWTVSILYP